MLSLWENGVINPRKSIGSSFWIELGADMVFDCFVSFVGVFIIRPVNVMCAATSRIPYTGILAVLLMAVTMGPVNAEIGYDCGGKIQNTTTISLVDNCDLHIDKVDISIEVMALLRLNEFEQINIVQCKVEIHRYIHWCGNTVAKNDFHDYLEAITREDCLNAISTGSFNLRGTLIVGLTQGVTNERQITFAGIKNDNKTCDGAEYSDPYGTWKNVVATGKVNISLGSQSDMTKVEADKILLPSENQCKFSKGECVDSVGGYTFLDALPRDNCNAYTYSLLYKGTATQYKSNAETVYTVYVEDTSFSFTAIETETSCGATLLKTESSNLFLIQSDDLKHLEESNIVKDNNGNFNMFKYENDVFVYVERHIRSQVRSLYLDVLRHRCELKKEILMKTLPLAYTQPDEFAFRYMDGPGYMVVLAGEVIHIVQCVPVEVKINHLDKCYNRLQVLKNNQSVVLMQRTHVITSYATEVPCSSPLLEHYKLSGTWYALTPRIVSTREPTRSTKLTWTNVSELPSENQCKFSKGECVDSVGGYTFWDALPRDNCNAYTYSLLYKGTATQYKSNAETVYTVYVEDTSFSFTAIGPETSCGATLLKTESSNLFLIQSVDLKHLEESNIVEDNNGNFNMFKYENDVFVYVERHIRSQVRSLYLDVLRHRCELKKEILMKTLPLAYTQPDEFAFRYMDGPGYMVVLAGEVIHIVQCVPVEVKINHLDKYYNRLQVLKSNQSVVLMQRTHVITSYATEVPCSSPLLEHYKLSGTWYALTPRIVSTREPTRSTKLTWTNVSELLDLGIYTQEDLDSMGERIMFPLKKNHMRGSPSIVNTFNDETRDESIETIWIWAWGMSVKFGAFCSSFIGIYMCFILLKNVADFVLYGFRL